MCTDIIFFFIKYLRCILCRSFLNCTNMRQHFIFYFDQFLSFLSCFSVFYVLLYYVWRKRYQVEGEKNLTIAVYALSAVRVLLCMMPQNQWLTNKTSLTWGILRNIPFALLGLLIIVLFYRSAKDHSDKAFRWMWLTIVLSFGFYIPVVLWADVNPLIGMLMIPKTCAYVWTVLIGYNAMKAESSGSLSDSNK